MLADLSALPQAREATRDEVLALIDAHRLFGRGIGYIDMHLLAASITNGDRIWVRDKRTAAAAALGIAHVAPQR